MFPMSLIVSCHSFVHRYFSPYPLTEQEIDESPPSASSSHPSGPSTSGARITGVSRTSIRAHGRTSDILAGGLRRNGGGEKASVLWVCDRCFKYMADGGSWDMHAVSVSFSHLDGLLIWIGRKNARGPLPLVGKYTNEEHMSFGR